MIETGLMEYWVRKYAPRPNRCSRPPAQRQAAKRLSAADLQSAFLVLAIGSALSAGAFVAELFGARFLLLLLLLRCRRRRRRCPSAPQRLPSDRG